MKTATHRLPGLVLSDHWFTLPLDYNQPDGEKIEVYAREVVSPLRENADLPWLVFFQGGPGLASPRPEDASQWLKRALQDYRVLLLDQRGVGRSTPLTFQTLARFPSPQAMADYLKHFRADAIVQDAEHIRRNLIGSEPWSALGQSFGGFCLVHYLSAAPQGLREAIFTGGLPSLDLPAEEVYRATYPRVLAMNQRYYKRYPEDIVLAQSILRQISAHPVMLPNGDPLTPRRFQQAGMDFGMSNGFERLHYLLEEAIVPGLPGGEISYTFLRHLDNFYGFDTNPLYALLHEAIYCQGTASRWAAERVLAEFPQFELSSDRPVLFTGEMIYPWMFEDYQALRPLKAAAEILAEYADWPALYDPAVLRQNTVPCAAVMYYDDMYVERRFSEGTARAIQGLKAWITNEYGHNGLRQDGEKLLGHLLAMLHGEV